MQISAQLINNLIQHNYIISIFEKPAYKKCIFPIKRLASVAVQNQSVEL